MVKRIGFLLGIFVACLAIWSTLGNPGADQDNAVGLEVAESLGPKEVVPENLRVPAPEPLRVEEQSTVDDEPTSKSCDELARLTETTGFRIGFAEGVQLDEETCERGIRMATQAKMPALPGLAGFDVPDIFDTSPAHQLADEPDDPSWARGMEGQVLSTIASLIDFPVNSMHAVCRTKTCGLVLSYRSSDHSISNYNYYAQELADELGFSGFHAGVTMPRSGNAYMSIYVGDWQTSRPDSESPAPTVPSTFEEALDELQSAQSTE